MDFHNQALVGHNDGDVMMEFVPYNTFRPLMVSTRSAVGRLYPDQLQLQPASEEVTSIYCLTPQAANLHETLADKRQQAYQQVGHPKKPK